MCVKGIILGMVCLLIGYASFGQAPPQANFNTASTNGCTPLIVQFNDATTGNATWWQWDFGNGTSSSQQNPGVIYTEPGIYTITLITGNSNGSDTLVRTAYIQAYGKPEVAFSATPATGCLPMTVLFTDSSKAGSGTITNYIWDLGDGQISAQARPSHIYTNAGSFDISLSVQNSFGCKQVLQKKALIKVTGKVTAAYDYSYINACQPPTQVQFTNQSAASATLTCQWAFGDGSTSTDIHPKHTYGAAGDYTTQLVVVSENGCTDTISRQITIGTVKPAFTVSSNACTGTALTFTNTSAPSPLTSSWSFGDGAAAATTHTSHSYATAGDYSVTLRANFGNCTDSITRVIKIADKPVTAFTTPGVQDACAVPVTVAFNNASTGAISYQWNFGDGTISTNASPSHTYSQPGYYTISLTSSNAGGCSTTITKQKLVHVGPPRITAVKNLPFSGCVPATIDMAAILDSAQSITSLQWDFGDGTTSTEAAPTHTYTKEGGYDVSLIIRTSSGCADTFRLQHAVNLAAPPVADFSANPLSLCGSKPFTFTDHSTGNPTGWWWQFGDGQNSGEQNPKHSYSDTGLYTITLIANNNQCYDTLIRKKYIRVEGPVARFKPNMQCTQPYERSFTDQSVAAGSWLWSFGDGQTSTTQHPTHRYTSAGTYTVQLIASNNNCTDTARRTIYIADEHPSFTYAPANGSLCKKQPVTVTATNYTPQYITAFKWDFGETPSPSDQSASAVYTYQQTGNHRITLTATDVNGCMVTAEKTVAVDVFGASAQFTNRLGTCLKDGVVDFTDQSVTDGTHAITQWQWNFGDGQSQAYAQAPFAHTYIKAGNYNVRLIVTDSYGCQDTLVKNAAVTIAAPKASFKLNDSISCTGSTVPFINASQGLSLTSTWYFGDGKQTVQTSPAHSYTQEGQYNIALSVKDRFGCTDSVYKQHLVTIANPVASFSLTDTFANCPPLLASPENTSQYFKALSWDFDDGTTTALDSPQHAYTQGGEYHLKLIVQGHGSCTATATKTIIVKGPSGKYIFSPTTACNPAPVAFKATVKNTSSLVWDFSDGTVVSGTDTQTSHIYKNAGAYVPRLVLIDSRDCKVGLSNKDTLFVSDVKALMSTTLQTGCDSALVAFKDSSKIWYDQISKYTWRFGDTKTGSTASPSHHYYTGGIYEAQLTVTTQKGCKDSVTLPLEIPVYLSPRPAIEAADSTCFNSTVHFAATDKRSNTAITSWQWQYGNGKAATGQTNDYIYPYTGQYQVSLTATDAHGCQGVAERHLTVLALPALDAGMDTSLCLGQSVILHPTGADRYIWQNLSSLDCAHCATATAKPVVSTRYYLEGRSTFGCVSNDSLFVEVKQPPRLSKLQPDTLCVGESTQLTVSGAETYRWSPATGLSNARGASPVVAPTTTTTYHLIGGDTRNCFSDSQSVTITVYPIPVFKITDSIHTVNVGYADTLHTTSSEDITRWQWYPATGLSCANCPQPVVLTKQDVTYIARVFNPGGCTASDQVTVHVLCNGINVFMPNTFSPNNDGMNDEFYPRGKGLYNIRALRIFNRWGQAVFERTNFMANNASNGWDGRFSGQPAQAGVYVYVLEIECDNGTVMTYKGNVALLR